MNNKNLSESDKKLLQIICDMIFILIVGFIGLCSYNDIDMTTKIILAGACLLASARLIDNLFVKN